MSKDSGQPWANELEAVADEVTVVHRRNQFGGHEQPVEKMMESAVNVRTPYVVSNLHANELGNAIQAVTIARVDEDGEDLRESKRIAVDAVIVNHGTRSDWGKLIEWGWSGLNGVSGWMNQGT